MSSKSVLAEIGEEADNVEILVIDDHPLTRLASREVLKEVKGDANVLEASSCSQAMQVLAEHPNLDLILLDLNLPDRDGFSMLTELGERYPAPPSRIAKALSALSTLARSVSFRNQASLKCTGEPDSLAR